MGQPGPAAPGPCARIGTSLPDWGRKLTPTGEHAPGVSSASGLAAAAGDGDLARAGHLDEAERAHHALERLDFLPGARDLHDHGAARDVDDLAAEDLHDLHDLAAARAVGGDLEQRELARDRVGRLEVADLDHVDQLVQLLGDLVDRVHRPVEGERDARERLVVGRAHGERVDVEPPPREEPGDPGQDARLVLHEDGQDVLAARPHAGGRLELLEGQRLLGARLAHRRHPTISRAAAPAGIIGYVFSSRVTRTSTTTGPSVASAVLMSARSVDLSVSRMPVAPYASASLTKSGHRPMSTCE